MIKKFIARLLGKIDTLSPPPSAPPDFGQRREIPYSVHGIDSALIEPRAATVVQMLQDAGFDAYIVGGAVRDLLLGLAPKDFDVATSATPEQVKQLFGRSRQFRAFIIGKRFRIVHVVWGRGRAHEVIEVSTFRAYLDNAAAPAVSGNERTSRAQLSRMQHAVDASGRVLRDNVWGPQDQDATRRDFTVNAMYYDPARRIVVDFHGGMQDVRTRSLRMIGDAAVRYREDPVRIIRAVRFAAKLHRRGFTLEPATAAPLQSSLPLLADVPQSRLFDEMLKLLQTGHGCASIAQLRHLGLTRGIYPLLDVIVERADLPLVAATLVDTDRRVGEGKSVAPSFLLACVLWPDVQAATAAAVRRGMVPTPALFAAIDEVFNSRIGDISGRGKLAADMREIWAMQPRFEKRTGNAPFALVDQPRFRAGYDFLMLRADTGDAPPALLHWWQTFIEGDNPTRYDLIDQAREEQRQQQRERSRAANATIRRAAGSHAPEESPDGHTGTTVHGLPDDGPPAAARRRRTRRRKPTGATGADAHVVAPVPQHEVMFSRKVSADTDSAAPDQPAAEVDGTVPTRRARRRKPAAADPASDVPGDGAAAVAGGDCGSQDDAPARRRRGPRRAALTRPQSGDAPPASDGPAA